MSKPARPGLKFNNLDELVADVDQLNAGPYEKAGRWDLPMIVDHLAMTMNGPFGSGAKNIPWPAGPVVRFVFHRIAQRKTYPHVKFPAPKIIQPKSGVSMDVVHAELIRGIDRLNAVTGETIDCPPFGTLLLEDFKKMQLLHGAHHLSFLKSR